MARSWLEISKFDKLRNDRQRRNRPFEADNAAHTTKRPIPGGIFYVIAAQNASRLGQFGDIGSDPPGLVASEQLRRGPPAELIFEIDICERLAITVADDKTGLRLFDG